MEILKLSCQCGEVTGHIKNVSPKLGNRLICYCGDCRTFAHELNQDKELTPCGGSRIFQVPLNHFVIDTGLDKVACLRLSEKGVYRWYTTCCNTMVGNTLKPETIPFIGVLESFFADGENTDQKIGAALGGVNVKSALSDPSQELVGKQGEGRIQIRCLTKLFGWKLTGKGKPNVLFDDGPKSKAIVKPKILR